VGRDELESYPDAVDMLRREGDMYGMSESEVEEHIAALGVAGGATV
jgi:hypothetical protein